MFALLALVAVLHLTAKDNNKQFTVKPHETIVMRLTSNSSAGCSWKYTPTPLGSKVVKLVSHGYGRTTNKEIWRFRAGEMKASTDLGFTYTCESGFADVVSVRIRVR